MTLSDIVIAAGSAELFGLLAVLAALARARRRSSPASRQPRPRRSPVPARRLV